MNIHTLRKAVVTGLLISLPFASPLAAAQGLFGMGDDNPVPQLTLARAEIKMDVPTPMLGNDFDALLAQATTGNSISELKKGAIQHHSEQLRVELDQRLREFLNDEDVPLVASNDALTLHQAIDVSVVKHLGDIKNRGDYELERGNLVANGNFLLRIQNPQGEVLKEKLLDIADLRLKEKYLIKTPHDGSPVEDNTEEQIEALMREMVDRILSRVDNDLEADSLRELALAEVPQA